VGRLPTRAGAIHELREALDRHTAGDDLLEQKWNFIKMLCGEYPPYSPHFMR
jgi:hypothetical protein